MISITKVSMGEQELAAVQQVLESGWLAQGHCSNNGLQAWRAVSMVDGSDIGMSAILMPGMTTGKGVQVGAGAVVTTDDVETTLSSQLCQQVPLARAK